MLTSRRRRGVSIRLFLVDGTPEGLRIVDRSNWSGRAVMCSRTQYPDVRKRDEFLRPGVYLLFGPSSEGSGRQTIYIGQADIAQERLDSHLRTKDFWTHLILFSSKDANLNKAHVQYLEARLIEFANTAKRVDVENGNAPRLPSLSEADRADMDNFLEDMLLIYPILGVTAFEVVNDDAPTSDWTLQLRGIDTLAVGKDTPEGFIVQKGARGRSQAVPSLHQYLRDLRDELLKVGVLVSQPDGLVLIQDYRFDSPSTAAAVLLGRTANGRVEWKDNTGRTLRELQEVELNNSEQSD